MWLGIYDLRRKIAWNLLQDPLKNTNHFSFPHFSAGWNINVMSSSLPAITYMYVMN